MLVAGSPGNESAPWSLDLPTTPYQALVDTVCLVAAFRGRGHDRLEQARFWFGALCLQVEKEPGTQPGALLLVSLWRSRSGGRVTPRGVRVACHTLTPLRLSELNLGAPWDTLPGRRGYYTSYPQRAGGVDALRGLLRGRYGAEERLELFWAHRSAGTPHHVSYGRENVYNAEPCWPGTVSDGGYNYREGKHKDEGA